MHENADDPKKIKVEHIMALINETIKDLPVILHNVPKTLSVIGRNPNSLGKLIDDDGLTIIKSITEPTLANDINRLYSLGYRLRGVPFGGTLSGAKKKSRRKPRKSIQKKLHNKRYKRSRITKKRKRRH